MARIPRVLLVYHSRTGFAEQMAHACASGAASAAAEMGSQISVLTRRARDATSTDLLSADGYLFTAPENLASVSGEMLEFFHSCYYSAFSDDGEDRPLILGRPVGIAVAAGSDGSMAARQMSRICTGWRLNFVTTEPLILHNGLVQTKANILSRKSTLSSDQVTLTWTSTGLTVNFTLPDPKTEENPNPQKPNPQIKHSSLQ